jgi:hypothetical protein
MALTEETKQDKIEAVGDFKIVQVRTVTIIKRDGAEISRSYHRHTIAPNISADDLANESAEVQAVCNAVHTNKIKTAYTTFLENQGV